MATLLGPLSEAGTLDKAQAASTGQVLSARLGAALDWLLAHWIDGPELVCGDADSSLLAMARRDSQGEDRILTGRFGR